MGSRNDPTRGDLRADKLVTKEEELALLLRSRNMRKDGTCHTLRVLRLSRYKACRPLPSPPRLQRSIHYIDIADVCNIFVAASQTSSWHKTRSVRQNRPRSQPRRLAALCGGSETLLETTVKNENEHVEPALV